MGCSSSSEAPHRPLPPHTHGYSNDNRYVTKHTNQSNHYTAHEPVHHRPTPQKTSSMGSNQSSGIANSIMSSSEMQEYNKLESYQGQYWIDPNEVIQTRKLQSTYMQTTIGHYCGKPVLIKSLNLNACASDLKHNRQLLVQEIISLTKINHPKIVTFKGFYIAPEAGLCCITEFMEGKTLRHLLDNKRAQLSWPVEKLNIATDIVEAMVYLHSLRPQLIHRNIKADKVLLTNRKEAKLSGFGSSRDRTFEATMTSGVGTVQWSAPEILQGEEYDEKVDVYSFGVLLTELDSRKVPFDQEAENMACSELVMKLATGSLRPQMTSECPNCILQIFRACIQHDPELRPTSSEVLTMLQKARLELLQVSVF